MTDAEPPATPRAPSRVLSVLLILVGIVLLLPGVCAGFFIIAASGEPQGLANSGLGRLWAISFTITAGGIALIAYAIRRLAQRRSLRAQE